RVRPPAGTFRSAGTAGNQKRVNKESIKGARVFFLEKRLAPLLFLSRKSRSLPALAAEDKKRRGGGSGDRSEVVQSLADLRKSFRAGDSCPCSRRPPRGFFPLLSPPDL